MHHLWIRQSVLNVDNVVVIAALLYNNLAMTSPYWCPPSRLCLCTLDLTTKFTGGLCWDPCPCSISPLSGCRDTFWGLDDIYWCSVPGWTVLCLTGVIGCQFTVAWWSQQWPPEGNNCVVINVIISLSCTAFCFAPCVDVWIHIWCNYCNKHNFDLTWLEYCWISRILPRQKYVVASF